MSSRRIQKVEGTNDQNREGHHKTSERARRQKKRRRVLSVVDKVGEEISSGKDSDGSIVVVEKDEPSKFDLCEKLKNELERGVRGAGMQGFVVASLSYDVAHYGGQVRDDCVGVDGGGEKGDVCSGVEAGDASVLVDDGYAGEVSLGEEVEDVAEFGVFGDRHERVAEGADAEIDDGQIEQSSLLSKIRHKKVENVDVGDDRQDASSVWRDDGKKAATAPPHHVARVVQGRVRIDGDESSVVFLLSRVGAAGRPGGVREQRPGAFVLEHLGQTPRGQSLDCRSVSPSVVVVPSQNVHEICYRHEPCEFAPSRIPQRRSHHLVLQQRVERELDRNVRLEHHHLTARSNQVETRPRTKKLGDRLATGLANDGLLVEHRVACGLVPLPSHCAETERRFAFWK